MNLLQAFDHSVGIMFLRRDSLVLAAFLNEVIVDATEDHNSEQAVLVVRVDKAVRSN